MYMLPVEMLEAAVIVGRKHYVDFTILAFKGTIFSP